MNTGSENIKSARWVKDLIDTNKNLYMILISKDDKTFSVPLDEANRHYQAIQEWVAEGNTIEAAE
jgi:hypothetical protein